MIDQVFDNFRKASETTMQMQQELFKQWTSQWATAAPTLPGVPTDPAAWGQQLQTFQKRWLETLTEMMNKHRESLDAQYKAGIRAIEESFRVNEAKTPDDYRRMTEELWRKGFESLKSSTEAQVRDFQAAAQKWCDLVAKAKA
jgi:ribosome-associated toxin RatA of RatAB toxin-antitoxin module